MTRHGTALEQCHTQPFSPSSSPTPDPCPSRPQGKLDTEELLRKSGVNFTSVRPVYIYGPLNYNPVEEWFFHRLKAGRPIPVPGSGQQVTQVGCGGAPASGGTERGGMGMVG